MATMIRQTLRLDRASTYLFDEGFFNIIGPNEAIILPRAWEHMVRAGWHVRLELLYDRKVEHQCIEIPQACRQVNGTANLGVRCNIAKVFEEATRSLEIAQQEAAQEARQKEMEEQEELHRSLVEIRNLQGEEQNEHEKARRAREEERNDQKDMQRARAAEREEQRVVQEAREHEQEAQSRQQEAQVRASTIDPGIAAGAEKQKITPQARGCCLTTLQRRPTEPTCIDLKTRHRCSPIQKRRARYLVWFVGGSPRYGCGCCRCCKC